MSDVFGISISALQAFQTAIAVTSNNIANANTPGYAEEIANLVAAAPQTNGTATVGAGVDVSGISRAYSQLAENQLRSSQSNLSQTNGLQTYTNQIDNIVGTTAGGLTSALQGYYNAWSTLSTDPTSSASRQALLSQAQAVASSIQSTNSQLQGLNTAINTGITSDVGQINSLVNQISTLNQQITIGTAQASGQPPNDLLDQRDQLINSLSSLVGITTTTNSDGSLNVFVGNGQPLVLQGTTTQLTTVQNPFNASQLEVSTSTDNGNPISSQITSGDLGGLLAARTQAVDPAINQLGQIATALAQSANAQQYAGLDQNGNVGAQLFALGAPLATSSANNTDATTAAAAVGNVGALTADDYVLSYQGGAYTLTNTSNGTSVPLTNVAGTGNPPQFNAVGLTITLSATPAAGDQFLIQGTANAAGGFGVALSNPAQFAAAAALSTTAAAGNAGSAAIASIANPTDQPLPSTTTITFTGPTTYTLNGGPASGTLSAAGVADIGGWQVQFSGTPANGDVFTLASNAGASGDNRNALASAAQQNQGVLSGGTQSVNGAVSALITGIGSQAQQINTAQTALAAVNSQAQQSVQAVSGVDLNTEAANLLQWQQAFAASAQALTIANQTFTTLIDSINGTYT